MACSTCKKPDCGCTGTYTVAATCPPACSEVFNAQCIVYTGVDLICDGDTVISRNDYLDSAITKLVNYVCSKVAPPASVVAGSAFIDVVPTTDPVTAVTTYTVSADMAAFEIWVGPIITNQILAKVLAGPGIDVAADGVAGTVTVSHEDTSTVVSPLTVSGTGNTFLNGVSFGFDTFGHVTSAAFTTGTVVPPNTFVTAKINPDSGFTWGPDNNPTDLQTAEAPGDTLNFVAGTGITLNGSTVASTDAIRITNSDPNVDQFIWATIAAKDGSLTTASTTTDLLTITGDANIDTEIVGDTLTIKNTSPAKNVTLTSAGGTVDLVNDGLGPALATKGLSAGTGITLVSSATECTITNGGVTSAVPGSGISVSGPTGAVTITADVEKYDAPVSVPAPGAGGTIAVAHNLSKLNVMVTVRDANPGGNAYYAGVDYTVTFTDNDNLVITDIGGNLSTAVTYSVMG